MHGQGMSIWANTNINKDTLHGPGIVSYLADNEFKGDSYIWGMFFLTYIGWTGNIYLKRRF